MSRLFCMMFIALLTGCNQENADWRNAMIDRKCSVEQFEVVEKEANYCNATTDYFGSFCLGTAMIRHCPIAALEKAQ